MPTLERLFEAYGQHVALPWSFRVPPPQRVWFLPYAPEDERRLKARRGELRNRTEAAGHAWMEHDVTEALARWVGGHRYQKEYFENPAEASMALEQEFFRGLVEELRDSASSTSEDGVFALFGVASLYGAVKVARLVEEIGPSVAGRLLVPFPGRVEGTRFRLLDARDGWDYHATIIASAEPA